MVTIRTRALLSTFALVLGALLVGEAIHGSVTTSQYPITSPAAVLRFIAGGLLLLVGYRLKVPIEEYASTSEPSPEESETTDTADDYDPSLSPLGDAAPGEADRERDETEAEQDATAPEQDATAPEQDEAPTEPDAERDRDD